MAYLNFYKDKKVFVTGHTGFKGSWMCRVLVNSGAIVTGFSMEPPTNPNLYSLIEVEDKMTSIIGDIRNFDELYKAFTEAQPEIVIHMAAQPIVRDSYKDPRYTYDTNVMGTVNILECVRLTESVKSFLNVTTDKVYKNNEWEWGYRENEPLDGFDPYSNSKSCSELVTHSYKSSFFADREIAISTARAGNVIGGGDFGNDRIIPDCVRAALSKSDIIVRNPYSTRPYQHVLEPVMAYLMICQKQYEDMSLQSWYNVGPDDIDCITTGDIVDMFCKHWGDVARVDRTEENAPHEANFLKLDCSKIKSRLGWKPTWDINEAVARVCEWTRVYEVGNHELITQIMDKQIMAFINGEHITK